MTNRYIHFKDEDTVTPVVVFYFSTYLPFFLAEMFELSGIVAIFFTGIAARRYVNITADVRRHASFGFQLLAHAAETATFTLLGLSIFMGDLFVYELEFICGVVLLCLLSRLQVCVDSRAVFAL
jgi:NhaP-type Na+/H+ or K+/H+ antiporter